MSPHRGHVRLPDHIHVIQLVHAVKEHIRLLGLASAVQRVALRQLTSHFWTSREFFGRCSNHRIVLSNPFMRRLIVEISPVCLFAFELGRPNEVNIFFGFSIRPKDVRTLARRCHHLTAPTVGRTKSFTPRIDVHSGFRLNGSDKVFMRLYSYSHTIDWTESNDVLAAAPEFTGGCVRTV